VILRSTLDQYRSDRSSESAPMLLSSSSRFSLSFARCRLTRASHSLSHIYLSLSLSLYLPIPPTTLDSFSILHTSLQSLTISVSSFRALSPSLFKETLASSVTLHLGRLRVKRSTHAPVLSPSRVLATVEPEIQQEPPQTATASTTSSPLFATTTTTTTMATPEEEASPLAACDVRWKQANFVDCAATYHQMVSTLTSNLKYDEGAARNPSQSTRKPSVK